MFGRPLLGRNLPQITTDFVDVGLDLGHLYDSLNIPVDWIDLDRLQTELTATLRQTYQQYSLDLPETSISETIENLTRGDVIDFGRLGERFQEEIILRIIGDPVCAEALSPQRLAQSLSDEVVDGNGAVARERFSLNEYGLRLMDCYSRLVAAETSSLKWADSTLVLEQFLNPESFNFLRA